MSFKLSLLSDKCFVVLRIQVAKSYFPANACPGKHDTSRITGIRHGFNAIINKIAKLPMIHKPINNTNTY